MAKPKTAAEIKLSDESKKNKKLLHTAILSGNKDFIKTLLAKVSLIDVLTPYEQNKTLFHLAIDEIQLFTIRLMLFRFDVEALDEKFFLHYAVEKNDINVVQLLIENGFSLKKKNEKNMTPFCIALKNKKFEMIDILLSYCSIEDINPNNYEDVAPIYICIIRGNLRIIKKYVNSGLPINLRLKMNSESWSCLANYSGFTLLHLAVKHVNLKIVNFLLSAEANIFVQNEDGLSPLHIAFGNKQIGLWKYWSEFQKNNSIIDVILKTNTKFSSNPVNNHGLSHFHIACSTDKPAIVEHFLSLGVSINQPVESQCHPYKNFSPLHFAVKFRCKNTMDLLLRNGADVKQKDFYNMTALHIAARESCLNTVSLLLEYSTDVASKDSQGKTPIHWAFEKKNYKTIDLLLSVPNVTNSNPTNSKGVSHFHIACTRNNVKAVKSFIENGVCLDTCVPTKSDGDVDTHDADWSGYSPLHFAVCHNRVKIVQLLLDSGANVRIKDSKGFTPLHVSCQYTHEMFGEFIENILCKDEKVTQSVQPITDVTRIHNKYPKRFSGSLKKIDWSPHRKDHLKLMNLLLNCGSDINAIDNNGNAPILYAYSTVYETQDRILKNNLDCSSHLSSEIVESLSKELYERRKLIVSNISELDINLDKCYKNCSILHYIASNPQKNEHSNEMIEFFLKKGANVNVRNESMSTPLHCATLAENTNLISLLLDHGANVNCVDPKDNSTPLLIASTNIKPWNVIEMLVEKGANVNARKSDGRTALHNLALHSYDSKDLLLDLASVLAILIEAGADINSRDSNGSTALHLACEKIVYDTVLALLACGADINVEDNEARSVSCYFYEKHVKNLTTRESLPDNVSLVMMVLQAEVIVKHVIGLPLSEKVLSANSKFEVAAPQNDERKVNMIKKCQSEVEALRDIKIHGNCTLYDVIFKNENSMAQLVKNPAFQAVIRSGDVVEKYRYYGCFIRLRYRQGVDRLDLLSEGKYVLNHLSGMQLPDICSENICKYFTNAELRGSIEILRGMLDFGVENSDDSQLKSSETRKRQKVD